MLSSEATIELDRPGRYLVQLCKHANAMGRTGGGHRPRNHATGVALASGEIRVRAEHSDTDGVVTISPWGRCILRATGGTLALGVEAVDEHALQQIQTIVSRDLERFGRRDGLIVAWSRPQTSDTDLDLGSPATESGAGGRRGLRSTVLIAVLLVAALLVHLGLAGAIAANREWANLSLGVILPIVGGKVLLIALGRRAHRRGLFNHPGARRHSHSGQSPDSPETGSR